MKKTNKILSLLLLVSLTACGGSKSSSKEKESTSKEDNSSKVSLASSSENNVSSSSIIEDSSTSSSSTSNNSSSSSSSSEVVSSSSSSSTSNSSSSEVVSSSSSSTSNNSSSSSSSSEVVSSSSSSSTSNSSSSEVVSSSSTSNSSSSEVVSSSSSNTSNNSSSSSSSSDNNSSSTSTNNSQLLELKENLIRLLSLDSYSAFDYFPETMSPAYDSNLVSIFDVNYDFTTFTNTSSISKAGFGEQWQMVVDNIEQSNKFATVLNTTQNTISVVGNVIDAYITLSYAPTIDYTFSRETFDARFAFDGASLAVEITYKSTLTVPFFGSVIPTIRLSYDTLTNSKTTFVSLGEGYKIKYTVNAGMFEMFTTYGIQVYGKEASRSAYLLINNEPSLTSGHIYEYTSLEGNDLLSACADFYVEGDYVSVVGNKSHGLTGFKGYINELYLVTSGRLLGYEVREELSIAGVKGTYNTLWFNIWDIEGINTIKINEKSDANTSNKSTVDVYLNGSNSLFTPTYNTKPLVGKTSRKYDIEYRNRFYYSYDTESASYTKIQCSIPMMFIQEGDNFNSFENDMLKDNGINASVTLMQVYLDKIMFDYDTLIDIFIQNKDNMSSQIIIDSLN